MYIVENKIKEISPELVNFLLENNTYNIIDDLKYSENSNNYYDLSCSDPSKISYLKGDRIPENKNLLYNDEYRKSKAYHCKIGKLLSDKISQKDIQKISAVLIAKKSEFVLKLTDKICSAYLEDNYSDNHGTNGQLHSSCMRYYHLQSAIKFYESIGTNHVELLVALDNDNKIVGRALLWHNVIREGHRINYLDRIYTSNDNIKQLFIDYADQHSIITREDNTCNLKIDVKIASDHPLPYFDTFNYYDLSGFLSNRSGEVSLEGVEGQSIDELYNPHSCYNCNSSLNNDEAYYSQSLDDYLCCDCGYWIESENDYLPEDQVIVINGTAYYKESDVIVFSEYENDYLLSEDSIWSEYESDYFCSDNNDIVFSEHERDYFLSENVVFSEFHQDYFLSDNVKYSEYHEDYLLESDNSIVYSKYHNDYFIESNNDVVYIESENDYFLTNDNCIYYDEKLNKYMHRQVELVF